MAKKRDEKPAAGAAGSIDDFTASLIKTLNAESDDRVAYNLETDVSPTHIKRWISTGCIGLDYIVSNRRPGGLPEGRIVEIYGPPSIGKSHVAIQIARSTQQLGGVVVYIDTENAMNVENLSNLGVRVGKQFVFCEASTVEEVFQIAERAIVKARELQRDVPITIIWDSVAGTPPAAELKADYDDAQIGAQARAISKGMRKITQTIGAQNVLFVVCNQTRTGIGVMFGDPTVVPGGKAIPYHSSVRIRLSAGQQIKDADDNVIGIHVTAKTVKNKVSNPFRQAMFEIHFGRGIREHEQLFDLVRAHCDKNGRVHHGELDVAVSGTGSWKSLEAWKTGTEELVSEKKFYKAKFDEVMVDPEHGPLAMAVIDAALTMQRASIDTESYSEVMAAADHVADSAALEDIA